jgi:hypothetical protein
LLCPNCHEEEHFFRKTGRFIPRKRQPNNRPVGDSSDSSLHTVIAESPGN